MNGSPDFRAELQYFTTEQGGRNTPAFTDYFPQVKFNFSETQIGGRQKFIDKEVVYPGENVAVEITLLSPEAFNKKLRVGFKFDFREGSKIMGTGIILEILNKKLLAL
jgi:translation elongation factor EF-Tu-like GTPase